MGAELLWNLLNQGPVEMGWDALMRGETQATLSLVVSQELSRTKPHFTSVVGQRRSHL